MEESLLYRQDNRKLGEDFEIHLCLAPNHEPRSPALPPHMTHLNAVQSRVFHCAFHTSLNLLVLAPTGAGKTMVCVRESAREKWGGGVRASE